MKPLQAFNQIDHPLILLFQAVLAYYLFKLFFSLRDAKAPLPQILAGLAFSVLSNLVGRVAGADWFFVADITQYGFWAAVTYASVKAVEASPKLHPDTTSGLGGFFNRYHARIQWSVGLVVAGILVYASVDTYYARQSADRTSTAKANTAVAVATRRYDANQKVFQGERKQIISGVSTSTALITTALPEILSKLESVSAAQTTLAAEHKQLAKKVNTKRPPVGKPAGGRMPIETIEPKTNGIINRTVETPEQQPEEQPKEKEKPKKAFFKWLFGGKSVSDSIKITPSDTLVFK